MGVCYFFATLRAIGCLLQSGAVIHNGCLNAFDSLSKLGCLLVTDTQKYNGCFFLIDSIALIGCLGNLWHAKKIWVSVFL